MPEPACCLSGFVFMDGEAIAGAEVQVYGPGGQVTLITQVHSGVEPRPYYQLSLSDAPLTIQASDSISITARYSGHEHSLIYTAMPGSQQVDVVLSRNQANDYVFERQIWKQADAGTFNNPRGIAVNSRGEILAVDRENARVQVFDINHIFLRQWGTPGVLPGQFSQPAGIAIDTNDNVYVADTGNHRIQKFSADGHWITAWGRMGGAAGELYLPSSISIDVSGQIYILSAFKVQKFSPDGTWIQSWGTLDWEHPDANGALWNAHGVSVDASGNVYVADTGNHRIQKFSADGAWLATWGGQGSANGQFLIPTAVYVDHEGMIYVADAGNNRIQKLAPDGTWLASWVSDDSVAGDAPDLVSLTVGHNGHFYAVNAGTTRIQEFSADGTWLAAWGDKQDPAVWLYNPSGLGVDGSGNVYVADTGNGLIRKFSSTGEQLKVWGGQGRNDGQFISPHGVALDSSGNVYVADMVNHRIQKFDSQGTWIQSWGGLGSADGLFYGPVDLAVDSARNVYVADLFNNRVQKFDSNGTWLASWYGAEASDGPFVKPIGIGVDGAGNVYVAEGSDNRRVQKLNPQGQRLAVWGGIGNGASQFSGLLESLDVDQEGHVFIVSNGGIFKFTPNGTRLTAWSVAQSSISWASVDASGHIYLTDSRNHRVQIFRPMSYTRPIATIQHLSAATLDPGETLVFQGLGQDSDETPAIAAYEWSSDLDGVIGTASTLTRSAESLTPGVHRITLRVQDSEGQWSEPVSESLYVTTPSVVRWGMLLYLDGDYADHNSLINAYNAVLDQLSLTSTNPYVQVAVQVDGPNNGDTRRMLISARPGGGSPLVTRIPYGEQEMDSPTTLADFIRWGQSSIPAPHYYLAIADHGQGLQGIAWDKTSDPSGGAHLTVPELGEALQAPGVAPIDVLHLDACSMGLVEIAYEVRGRVAFVVASQYLGWNYFAYDAYQRRVGANTTPADLALGITNTYAAYARRDGYPFTIAAINTARAAPVLAAVDRLAMELNALLDNGRLDQAQLEAIRAVSQKFESNGDYRNNDPDFYVDLLDWARQVRGNVLAVGPWAQALIAELEMAPPHGLILASQSESTWLQRGSNTIYVDLAKATGASIYYPPSMNQLAFGIYAGQGGGSAALQTTVTAGESGFAFASNSRWASFLQAALPAGSDTPLPAPPSPLQVPYRVFVPLIKR